MALNGSSILKAAANQAAHTSGVPKALPDAVADVPPVAVAEPETAATVPERLTPVEAKLREAESVQTRELGGIRVLQRTEQVEATSHLSLRIPNSTHAAVKMLSVRLGVSMQDFVLSAIDDLMVKIDSRTSR